MKKTRGPIKIRKAWNRNPVQRPHSTPKGKKGYKRSHSRKVEKEWGNV